MRSRYFGINGLNLQHQEISATGNTTTSSTTDATMSGMTVTPAAGTYEVEFDCDLSSATSGAVVTVSFYVGGVQQAQSQRKVMPFAGGILTAGSQRLMISVSAKITVNGSQAIDLRWSTSSGTITAAARSMQLVRTG